MPNINIIEEIRRFQPTESYLMTYDLDAQYYTGCLLPEMQKYGSKINVLIVDGNRLQGNVPMEMSSIYRAVKECILLPVFINGAFHPKIYLFKKIERNGVKLLYLIGSGNVTYPGLNTNNELFYREVWEGSGDPPEIFRSLKSYYDIILGKISGNSSAYAIKSLANRYPQKYAATNKAEYVELISCPNHSASPEEKQKNIFSSFSKLVSRDNIDSLSIVAPFYDYDLSALNNILKTFRPKRTEIILQEGTVSISKGRLLKVMRENKSIKLYSFKEKGYLHAKLIIAETGANDHILLGSANISDAALFGQGNYEACIYARVKRGFKQEALGLSLTGGKIREIDGEKANVNELPAKNIPECSVAAEIVSAEYYQKKLYVCLSKPAKTKQIKIKVLCGYQHPMSPVLMSAKQDGVNELEYVSADVLPNIAVYVCMDALASKKVPIIYLDEIVQLSKWSSDEIEKLKSRLLTVQNEDEQTYYMSKIIEHLINQQFIDQVSQPRTKFQATNQADEETRVSISLKNPIMKGRNLANATAISGNHQQYYMSILLNAHRDTKKRAVSEEMPGPKATTEIPEKPVTEVMGSGDDAVKEEILPLAEYAKVLKSRRRAFVRNINAMQFGAAIDYFSIYTLPQIKYISAYIINEDDEVLSCVDDDDWIDYIVEVASKMAQMLFAGCQDKIWPTVEVDQEYADIILFCIAAIIYCCASVYYLIQYRVDLYGDNYYGEAAYKMFLLCAALLHNVKISKNQYSQILLDKITDVRNEFPFEWQHLRKTNSYLKEVEEYEMNKFKEPLLSKYGELAWIKEKGFVVKKNLKYVSLWVV